MFGAIAKLLSWCTTLELAWLDCRVTRPESVKPVVLPLPPGGQAMPRAESVLSNTPGESFPWCYRLLLVGGSRAQEPLQLEEPCGGQSSAQRDGDQLDRLQRPLQRLLPALQ